MPADARDLIEESTPPGHTEEPLVTAEIDLRTKNQITLPTRVIKLLGLHPGDRLIAEVWNGTTGEVRLRRIRDSYAGALAGVYGSAKEAAAELEREREAWGE